MNTIIQFYPKYIFLEREGRSVVFSTILNLKVNKQFKKKYVELTSNTLYTKFN